MARIPGKYATKPGPGRTKQSFAMACNINNIMKKYTRTGDFAHVVTQIPQYGDFSNVDDYKSALDKIESARALFMELPAKVRAHVNNDPGQFLDFIGNPESRDDMIRLGLIEETGEETPPATAPPEGGSGGAENE